MTTSSRLDGAVDVPATPHDETIYLDLPSLWEILRRLTRVQDSVGTDWHAGHRTGRNIYKGEGDDDQIGSMDNRVLGDFVGHAAKDIERLLPIAMWARVDYDDAQRLDQMAREAHEELHKAQAALEDCQLKLVEMARLFATILEQGSPLRDGHCRYCGAWITRTLHKGDCPWLRARTMMGLLNL